MRNHKNLKAFHLADSLALKIYQGTKSFPKDELYGLTSQMRRAAVSIPSNIVEGCARESETEFYRYLSMAFGSARELEYQLTLAFRLGYLQQQVAEQMIQACDEVCRVLNGLMSSVKKRK